MRSRTRLLLLPVVVLLLLWVWLFRPHVPTGRTLEIHFGATGPGVREVGLHFQREQSVLRDLTLHFPSGASAEVTHPVALAPGEYDVGIRMVFVGGREAHLDRNLHVDQDEHLPLNLELQ